MPRGGYKPKEPSWGRLGAILGPPGTISGPSRGSLGAVLGHLGPSWATLGPSWGQGPPKDPLRTSQDLKKLIKLTIFNVFEGTAWGHLGAMLGHLGAILRNLRAILAHPGVILGPSWAILGRRLVLVGFCPTVFRLLGRRRTPSFRQNWFFTKFGERPPVRRRRFRFGRSPALAWAPCQD